MSYKGVSKKRNADKLEDLFGVELDRTVAGKLTSKGFDLVRRVCELVDEEFSVDWERLVQEAKEQQKQYEGGTR